MWHWPHRRARFLPMLVAFLFGLLFPLHFIQSVNKQRVFTFNRLLKRPATLAPDDPELIDYVINNVLLVPEMYEQFDIHDLALAYSGLNSSTASTTTTEKMWETSKSSLWSSIKRRIQGEINENYSQNGTGQYGQASIIDSLLGGKRNGFFIEAGAWDGEYLSNTLFFEKERNFTGLLIEPNPKAFHNLVLNQKRKKSVAVHSCLSIHSYPQQMSFDAADVFGGVVAADLMPSANMAGLRNTIKERKMISIQCFPLYTLLLALNNPIVDFMSLDVEGAEMAVLLSIPFDRVRIRCLAIEVQHSDKKRIVALMQSHNYRLVKKMKVDYIFAHNELI